MNKLKTLSGGRKERKRAMSQYIDGQCQNLKIETSKELARLKGACTLRLDDRKLLNTRFSINWSDLPGAREQDRIIIADPKAPNMIVARGFISSIEPPIIKIDLDSRPKFGKIKESKPDDAGEPERYDIQLDASHLTRRAFTIESAMKKLASSNRSEHIMNCLLGHYEERSNSRKTRTRLVQLVDCPKLSKKQMLAVEQSMMKKISLIEGIAGSGKTLVAANVAFSVSRIYKRKVLLCSPIQATVNRLANILSSDPSIKVVQLTPSDRFGKLDKNFEPSLCLEELVQDEIYDRCWLRNQLTDRIDEISLDRLSQRGLSTVSQFRTRSTERAILKRADVVCCTLEQSLSECLRRIDFKMLIIDDAQHATELECLLPLTFKGLKQVTIIGDMRRSIKLATNSMKFNRNRSASTSGLRNGLRKYNRRNSFVADNRIAQADSLVGDGNPNELGSLFERWLAIGLPSVVLKFQYRMRNRLDIFTRQYFYPFETKKLGPVSEQTISDDQSAEDKLSWLSKNGCATKIIDVDQDSYQDTITRIVSDIRETQKDASICLITNNHSDTKQKNKELEIGTVLNFLGQQRDFVLLLCREGPIVPEDYIKARFAYDFSKYDNALNIALTRARCGLIIVTDVKQFPDSAEINKKCLGDGWRSLIKYYRDQSLVLKNYPPIVADEEKNPPIIAAGEENILPIAASGDKDSPKATGDEKDPSMATGEGEDPLIDTGEKKDPAIVTGEEKNPPIVTDEEKDPATATGGEMDPATSTVEGKDPTTANGEEKKPENDLW